MHDKETGQSFTRSEWVDVCNARMAEALGDASEVCEAGLRRYNEAAGCWEDA